MPHALSSNLRVDWSSKTFCDLHIEWKEGVLPSMPKYPWLQHFTNTRVSTVFVTEDDLNQSAVIKSKVFEFLQIYGISLRRVKAFVMIARNPTDRWGKGFPFKMRISVFPKEELLKVGAYEY